MLLFSDLKLKAQSSHNTLQECRNPESSSIYLMLQFVTDNRYYVVRYTPSHYSNNPRYKYFNATDLNCMIDDLKPNTQYEFTVKVVKVRLMVIPTGNCGNCEALV